MEMRGPIEVGLCVGDVDKMVDFYTSALGFTEEMRFPMSAELAGDAGWAPNETILVFLKSPNGERLKLSNPQSPDRNEETFGGLLGFSYLTFQVSDIDGVIEKILGNGGKAISTPMVGPSGEFPRYGCFRDPEGNGLEIVESDPNQSQDSWEDQLKSGILDRSE